MPQQSDHDSPVLTWSSDPSTSISISWFNERNVTAVEVTHPSGSSRTIPVESRGRIQRAVVDELTPSTTYHYRTLRPGLPETESQPRSFRTAPARGRFPEGDHTLTFAVAGDLQPFNAETRRTTRMAMETIGSRRPDFIVQVGDVTEWGFSTSSWSQAFAVLSAAAAHAPLVPVAGNHDYYGVPAARFFKEALPAPYAAGDVRRDTWYSLSAGPVHIAVLDTEAKGRSRQEQIDWLEDDLSTARNEGYEWIFVAMHRPAISTSIYATDTFWAEALFPIIARYEVTAVFWGHDHMYEHYEYRYGANGYVFNEEDTVAARSTHLFTVGTSGARVDPLYPGFLRHAPRSWELEMHNLATASPEVLRFSQRPWNADRVYHVEPGIRFHDPAIYPRAASYFSWPFESAGDARAGRYSDDPEVLYSDAMPFFGYIYGETSIHYLWVEITKERCSITAYYADGYAGEEGTVIARPDGGTESWTILSRNGSE